MTPLERSKARLAVSLFVLLAGVACDTPPHPLGDESVPTPRVFAEGIVSTGAREYGISFTPDATEAYFTRRPRRGGGQIFHTRFVEGWWTEPELAPFSTDRDEAPYVSADGTQILFSSRRPMPGTFDGSPNLWVSARTADGWARATPLRGAVNRPRDEVEDYTVGSETGAFVLPGGTLLYSAVADPDWGSDVYVADPDGEGGFADPRPLRLNSEGDESNPVMAPDGRHLIFQGHRGAGGFGEQDLYVSERTDYGWGTPRPLSKPINSDRNDGYPSFSPDGRFFFFASDRDARNGYYSIYYVDVAALGLDPGP